jgi:hypothetical protein
MQGQLLATDLHHNNAWIIYDCSPHLDSKGQKFNVYIHPRNHSLKWMRRRAVSWNTQMFKCRRWYISKKDISRRYGFIWIELCVGSGVKYRPVCARRCNMFRSRVYLQAPCWLLYNVIRRLLSILNGSTDMPIELLFHSPCAPHRTLQIASMCSQCWYKAHDAQINMLCRKSR